MYAKQAPDQTVSANLILLQRIARQFNTNRIGGAERDRTADPLLAKQVLSQLSYSPNRSDLCQIPNQNGGPGQTRTADLTLIRRAL